MVVCIHKQSMIIHHSDHLLHIGMIRVMVVAHLWAKTESPNQATHKQGPEKSHSTHRDWWLSKHRDWLLKTQIILGWKMKGYLYLFICILGLDVNSKKYHSNHQPARVLRSSIYAIGEFGRRPSVLSSPTPFKVISPAALELLGSKFAGEGLPRLSIPAWPVSCFCCSGSSQCRVQRSPGRDHIKPPPVLACVSCYLDFKCSLRLWYWKAEGAIGVNYCGRRTTERFRITGGQFIPF